MSNSWKRLKDDFFKVFGSARKSRKVLDFRFENFAKKMVFDAKFEALKHIINVKTNTKCLTKLIECYKSKGCMQSNSNDNKRKDGNGDRMDDKLFMCTKSQLLQLIRIMKEVWSIDLISYICNYRCCHVAKTALQGKLKSNVLTCNSS